VVSKVSLAVLAAGSGFALVAGLGGAGAIILGVLTILTAGLNAISEVIGPGKKAEEHQKAAVSFGSLGVAYNTLVRTWNDDEVAAHRRFGELEDQHRRAEAESPEPEQWKAAH
jgi:hypothetical protein